MKKSANQLYKESGTSLSFKQWIEREKKLNFNGLNNDALGAELNSTIAQMQAEGGLVSKPDPNKVFGIDKSILAVGAILLVAGLGYYIVYSDKKLSV